MRCGGVLFFAFLLTALPELGAEKIDNRNFSIDTCYPTPNEIQLAEQRARKYWAMHAWRFGNDPFYLAVETSIIFPSEVQDKSPKLNFSETTASNRRRSYSYLVLKGIMIFDIRTGHFVGNTGFIVVDTPPLGGRRPFWRLHRPVHRIRQRSYSYLVLKGIMIFDIRTGHFIGNTGFIAVDTPPLGGVARFGD